MTERRLLISVVGGLLVVGLGLVAVLVLRDRPVSDPIAQVTASPEIAAEARQLITFMDLKPVAARDERIVLYGDSLVSRNNAGLQAQIKEGLNQPLEIVSAEQASSVNALTGLLSVFQRPPQVLVLDIVRFEDIDSLSLDRTMSNLTLIQQKAAQLGVKVVFLLGPSQDGNTTYAQVVQASLPPDALAVDASTLLQTSKYRESLVTLNDDGGKELGRLLVDVLKPLPAS